MMDTKWPFLSKLKLVVWKNMILRKRHCKLLIIELVLPLVLFGILRLVQMSLSSAEYEKGTPSYEKDSLTSVLGIKNLFYTPNNSDVKEIILIVKESLQSTVIDGFDTEADMMNHIANLVENKTYEQSDISAIVFDQYSKGSKNLKYKIRMENVMGEVLQSPYPVYPSYFMFNSEPYLNGFVGLQKRIDFAFIGQVSKNAASNTEMTLQRMPTPPHQPQGMNATISYTFLPLLMFYSFMIFIFNCIRLVIEEKSSGIKELMKMMGLKPWMLWLGWFIHAMITNIVTISAVTILSKISFSAKSDPSFAQSNFFIIWLFLFMYCVSGVFFSFVVSTVFNKASVGTNVGILLWMVMYIALMIVTMYPEKLTQHMVNAILLLPPACLILGVKALNDFECDEGLKFYNLWTKPNEYLASVSMGQVLLMLLVDSIIFLIITWYFENVIPAPYGMTRKWYFPFTKSFWISKKVQDETVQDDLEMAPAIEQVSTNLQAGIQIRNLRKKFKNLFAVDGLNLDIYSKQITVLLGHNGAGKTTTMNIVTGMLPATSGTVIVDGYDIKENLDKVRESLGLCPQHNLQFDELTVMEHLLFFAMLKGSSRSEAELESKQYLDRLNLKSKAKELAKKLSGGMRRKLSLGMALVGKTNVLLLDEPTTGMDPEARREIWDFLLGMRGERTILVTTHYMEEADILGDRIAIMHSGKLVCYGTSLFLKKLYGTGYTLSILTTQNWNGSKATELIRTYVPSAVVKSVATGTVTFSLPTNDTTSLSKLFITLESSKGNLGISNFGVSITSLEDVFLKVGELADKADNTDNKEIFIEKSEKYLSADDNRKDSVFLQRIIALFVKRLRYSWHTRFSILLQTMVPLVMSIILFWTMKSGVKNDENLHVNLNLKMYAHTESFYSFDSNVENLADCYKKSVEIQDGKASVTADVNQEILKIANDNKLQYHRTLIAAAQFSDSTSINAMYGAYPYHGPPISLNLVTNALLKSTMSDHSYSISTAFNPIPSNIENADDLNPSFVMVFSMMIPFGLIIMLAFFLSFPHGEYLTGMKHLQIMSGVSRWVYWITNYIFDFILFFIVTILVIIIFVAFDCGGIFGNGPALGNLLVLILVFGLACIPFTYLFHYKPTLGSVMNIYLNFFMIIGMLLPLALFLLKSMTKKYQSTYNFITYILLSVPHFAIVDGLQKFAIKASDIYNWENMGNRQKQFKIQMGHPCGDENSNECKDFLSFYRGEEDGIRINLIYLLCEIFIYSAILLLIDTGLIGHFCDLFMSIIYYRIDKKTKDNNIDNDVAAEAERVKKQINESSSSTNEREQTTEDILLVSNLRKYYKKLCAVRDLNFGVKKGELFGLLGTNGAGKTTTFKILTGEIFPNTGSAILDGISLRSNKNRFLKNIGYCPQFDALNVSLTTREMLEFFASLRGIHSSMVKDHVDMWMQKFNVKKYEHIQCGKLSGGNKRKLSTAIALIGNPPLIMLDEPTSGVDPVARRNLWDILGILQKQGQSIVLTSHSMDECETLCERLGIMVEGQMKCLGNIQYLKNKFGQGFTVMIKLRTVAAEVDGNGPLLNLKQTIENKYECTLKDEHPGMILYHITSAEASIGGLFSFVEKLKKTEDIIEDYAISDTSLEQVFLSFAKKDANPKNVTV